MDNMVKNAGLEKNKKSLMNGHSRSLPFHAVIYILRGRGTFRDVNTPEQEVGPGSAFYLFPDIEHSYDPLPNTVWTEYWVLYDGTGIENRFGPVFPKTSLTVPGVQPEIVRAYENLHDQLQRQEPDWEIAVSMELHRILALLYLRRSGESRNLFSDAVLTALEQMRDNPAMPVINYETVAQRHGITYETFRKQFKHQVGVSPHEYFIEMKLSEAQRLLLKGRNVKETAAEVGFEDQYYFSRLFKRHVGLPPSRFCPGK